MPKPFAFGAIALLLGSVSGLAPAAQPNSATVGLPVLSKNPAKLTINQSTLGNRYYWYDGSRRRELIVNRSLVADFGTLAQPKTVPTLRKPVDIIGKTGSADTLSQVFVDAQGAGGVRALPGGVLIQTRSPQDRSGVNTLLESFDTKITRPIGTTGIFWLLESAPGMASLSLANRIHEAGVVKSAAPNWWQQRATK